MLVGVRLKSSTMRLEPDTDPSKEEMKGKAQFTFHVVPLSDACHPMQITYFAERECLV